MASAFTPSKFRALIMTTSFLLFFLCLTGLSMAFSKSTNTHFDFRMLYTAAYMFRTGHGHQLYDYDETKKFQNELVSPAEVALPFDHLAYESLLYVPFSFLNYRPAYLLFFGVNLAFLIWSFRLLQPYLSPLEEIWRYLPAAIFACFLPVTMALVEGQDSIILLTLMVLTALKLGRGHDVLAGGLLGLGCFKFQYIVPIVLLFVFWRRWRFVVGFAACASIVTAISLWVTGVDGFVSYVHILGNISAHFSPQNGIKHGIWPGLMPNLRGLAYAIAGTHFLASNALTLFLSAGVFLWAIGKRWSFPLAVIVALLVSYHQTISDASLLILPTGLAAVSAFKKSSEKSILIAVLCAMVIVAPGPLMLAGVGFYLLAIPILVLCFLWDEDLATVTADRALPAG